MLGHYVTEFPHSYRQMCDHLDVGAEVVDLAAAGLLQMVVGPT